MAKINLRLTCSLIAVGAVALLALWPSTRPIIERQVWVLSGTYEKRVDQTPESFSGMVNDMQVLNLLTGYERIPVDSRALELAKIAAVRKDVALWAHVIRQTTMAPVPVRDFEKITELERLRAESLAKIQLTAAREGKRKEPDNVYFDLAEAAALAKLRKWNEISEVLVVAGKKGHYDDHILDEFRRRAEFLYARLHPVLPSDMGMEWSNILFPHLANFRAVAQILDRIKDPKSRLAAGLGLARTGRVLMRTDGEVITRLVGAAQVKRAAYKLIGQEVSERNQDLKPIIDKVVAQARALGATDIAAGWQEFTDWTMPNFGAEYLQSVPDVSEPMSGTQGLYLLGIVATLGAAIWLASNLDPSASNVVNLGLILLGLELPVVCSVERIGLSLGILAPANMLFVAFHLIRLPGKARLGQILILAALLLAAVSAALTDHMELFAGLVGLWGIPFAYSQWIRATAPKWVGVVLATVFFGFFLALLANSATVDAKQFGRHLGETVITVLALSAFWIPLFVAAIMVLTRVNLPDALRLMAKPLPFFALAAAGLFVWGTREGVHQQKMWQELTDHELSPPYRQVLIEAKKNAPLENVYRMEIADPRSPD